ncbi:hypothetical protein J1N35_028220 [Gossypium stocksii]|uniref:CRM domain-containing protein n=1 Tax=Gossypium stocksii TaxID=47602 RepID=A0A9D3ZRX1_9ROSI|nr:hypothetical protein J1N35_028220 [Gossypium stocksii]
MQKLLSLPLSNPPKHSSFYFFSHFVSKTTCDPLFSPISKPPKPKPKPPNPTLNWNPTRIKLSLPFDFGHSYSETDPTFEPIGFREPKRFSLFGPKRLDRNGPSTSDQLYLLCYGSLMHLYLKLVKNVTDGPTSEETREMRNRGLHSPALMKLSNNRVYVNVVARVREAFETEEVIRLDCTHVDMSDCKRIGAKLRDLVPCVPILFKDEQIILWRGKRDQECNSDISDANEKSSVSDRLCFEFRISNLGLSVASKMTEHLVLQANPHLSYVFCFAGNVKNFRQETEKLIVTQGCLENDNNEAVKESEELRKMCTGLQKQTKFSKT